MSSRSDGVLEAIQAGEVVISRKLFKRPPPRRMMAYAMDIDHLLIAEEEVEELEQRALAKGEVEVAERDDRYVLKLPKKLYDFYRLGESDYTIMVPEGERLLIVLAL